MLFCILSVHGTPSGCNRFSVFCHASLTLIPTATRECVTKRQREAVRPAVSSHPSSKCSYNGLQCRRGTMSILHSLSMMLLAVAVSEVKWSAAFCRL